MPELSVGLQIKQHSIVALLSRCDAAELASYNAIRSDDRCAQLRLSPACLLCLESGARIEASRKAMGCFFVPGFDEDARGARNTVSRTP